MGDHLIQFKFLFSKLMISIYDLVPPSETDYYYCLISRSTNLLHYLEGVGEGLKWFYTAYFFFHKNIVLNYEKETKHFSLNTTTVLVVVLSTVPVPEKKSVICADLQNCIKSLSVIDM